MKRRNSIALRFGRTLRTARRFRSFTLPTLEKASGVSRGLLSKIENGTGNPALITIHKIAKALGMDVSQLIS